MQNTFEVSSDAAVSTILGCEPNILKNNSGTLELEMQPDTKGKQGDVRDIIISRKQIQWEIGLSIKHNHDAVKHSRLAKGLDFGNTWYGIGCSKQYWNDIKTVFSLLEVEKKKGTKWKDLPSKEDRVFIPLLNAFIKELQLCYNSNGNTFLQRMVKYLIGRDDFYKIISLDKDRLTRVQTYNFQRTLNQPCGKIKPSVIIPESSFPTIINDIRFVTKKTKSKVKLLLSYS